VPIDRRRNAVARLPRRHREKNSSSLETLSGTIVSRSSPRLKKKNPSKGAAYTGFEEAKAKKRSTSSHRRLFLWERRNCKDGLQRELSNG